MLARTGPSPEAPAAAASLACAPWPPPKVRGPLQAARTMVPRAAGPRYQTLGDGFAAAGGESGSGRAMTGGGAGETPSRCARHISPTTLARRVAPTAAAIRGRRHAAGPAGASADGDSPRRSVGCSRGSTSRPPTTPRSARSSPASAAPSAKRASGSLARQRPTSASSAGATPASRGAGCRRIAAISAAWECRRTDERR